MRISNCSACAQLPGVHKNCPESEFALSSALGQRCSGLFSEHDNTLSADVKQRDREEDTSSNELPGCIRVATSALRTGIDSWLPANYVYAHFKLATMLDEHVSGSPRHYSTVWFIFQTETSCTF